MSVSVKAKARQSDGKFLGLVTCLLPVTSVSLSLTRVINNSSATAKKYSKHEERNSYATQSERETKEGEGKEGAESSDTGSVKLR